MKQGKTIALAALIAAILAIYMVVVDIHVFAAVDEGPIMMYASTPDGFSNSDPNTIKTIFATVHKADLGKSGFQWQATGQIRILTISR